MPRERLTAGETGQMLNQEKLRLIDVFSERSHSEIIYEILGGPENSLRCDFCDQGAKYAHHTKDHLGQHFLALICHDCAPKGYEILAQKRGGG